MAIRSRGKSFMVDVTVDGVRGTGTAATEHEAKVLEAELRLSLLNGQAHNGQGKGWTLGQAFERTCELVWKGTLAEVGSVRNGKAAVEYFGEKTPLAEVTTDCVDGYIARLQQIGNSNSTVNRKLAALSRILSFAVQRDKLVKVPHLERRKENASRIRFLTQQEETEALAWLSQWGYDEHAEALCVLIDTGLRPSELWKLQARDLDFERGVLSIWETKNENPRSVPMVTRVQEILLRRREIRPKGTLFTLNNGRFEDGWDRMKLAMGLERDDQFVPYALRHTCASRLVQRGTNIVIVQEWLGHKTITVTRKYGHLCPKNLMDAARVLEAC